MRRLGGQVLLAVLAFAAWTADARAHFLFIKVGPMAEGGRAAEVYFSEVTEAGDPKFVDKIAGTVLWAQTRPGVFEKLNVVKKADRLRAAVPAGGSLAVVGVCEYGVLARPNAKAFLLRHFPKAVAGRADVLNVLPRAEMPEVRMEVMATFERDHVRLVALKQGKPMPKAVFHTVAADLTNSEVSTGPDGSAIWTPPAPGRYAVYVSSVEAQPGTWSGQKYDEIREFATISFPWPLERTGADPEAVALFEAAIANRAAWEDFPGFSAEVAGSVDGRAYSGKVSVSSTGTVKADVEDEVARPWLEDQLGSIVMHRMADPDREKPVLRFAEDVEEHPLGRLLTFEGGRFASSYRVKDGQISVVNRHMGRQSMTITVLENVPNAEGKSLPHAYQVQYWDATSGALERVETIQERWARVAGIDLPASHLVTTSSNAGLGVRSLTLKNHKLAASQ